jgi:hypothetical protein
MYRENRQGLQPPINFQSGDASLELDSWEVEVAPEVSQWLGDNQTNLAAEIVSLADRRGLDVDVLPGSADSGRKDIAMILFASAAVIKALKPLIPAVIKTRFPEAVVIDGTKGGKRTLRVDAK